MGGRTSQQTRTNSVKLLFESAPREPAPASAIRISESFVWIHELRQQREPKNELAMDRPSGTWICTFFSGFGPGASGIYRFHLWRYVVRSLDKVPNRRRHACAIPGLVSRI